VELLAVHLFSLLTSRPNYCARPFTGTPASVSPVRIDKADATFSTISKVRNERGGGNDNNQEKKKVPKLPQSNWRDGREINPTCPAIWSFIIRHGLASDDTALPCAKDYVL